MTAAPRPCRRPIRAGALLFGLLATTVANAETPAPAVPKDGWRIVTVVDPATGARRCLAVDRIHGRKGGAFLAEIGVVPAAASDRGATVMLRVPNGADLTAGIGLRRKSGAITRAEWQSCAPDTCLATASLAAKETTTLLAEREISIVYRPLRGVPALDIATDLTGLKAVWEHVNRCPPTDDRP